jgi:hypothetical protein
VHSLLHAKPPHAPLGECLRRITPAAAMVINFGCKTQNTIKQLFLASNSQTFLLANGVVFETRNGPSTQLIDGTSCMKM